MLEGKTPAVGATRAQNAAKTGLDALADEAMQTKQKVPEETPNCSKRAFSLNIKRTVPSLRGR